MTISKSTDLPFGKLDAAVDATTARPTGNASTTILPPIASAASS
jgi:hypothetical protein